MEYRDMHASYLDSLSGARDEELPPPEGEEQEEEDLPNMSDIRKERFVRINTETDEMYQDLLLFPDEVGHLNAKLAADGSDFRWVPYGQREEDSVAA